MAQLAPFGFPVVAPVTCYVLAIFGLAFLGSVGRLGESNIVYLTPVDVFGLDASSD